MVSRGVPGGDAEFGEPYSWLPQVNIIGRVLATPEMSWKNWWTLGAPQ
ncbi:MAG TPA: hypothetical protein VLR26_13345 [Frankiaceae bacterium]|nr:hypothetical protein [Frankiaceae bacterium]